MNEHPQSSLLNPETLFIWWHYEFSIKNFSSRDPEMNGSRCYGWNDRSTNASHHGFTWWIKTLRHAKRPNGCKKTGKGLDSQSQSPIQKQILAGSSSVYADGLNNTRRDNISHVWSRYTPHREAAALQSEQTALFPWLNITTSDYNIQQ